MTKKRFTLNVDGETINDGDNRYCGEDVVELLNELHEKNKELRLQLNLCSDQRNEFHRGVRENVNRVGKLEKENEQLKSFMEYEKRQHQHWKRECLENIKEIAQLKREIVHLKGDDVND